MKDKLQSFFRIAKANKYYVLSYVIVAIISIIVVNQYIESEVDDSFESINNDVAYGVFENKTTFGIRDNAYTIVSYKESKLPTITEEEDSSEYEQQYGGISQFYIADGGWTIRVFERENNVIKEKEIVPHAVGLKLSSSDPETLFRQLYNNIIEDKDYNIDLNNEDKVSKLKKLESKFHNVDIRSASYKNESLMWYDLYSGKVYSRFSDVRIFKIDEKSNKIFLYLWLYIILTLFATTLLFILIRKFLKRNKKKPVKNKRKFQLDITVNSASEDISDTSIYIETLLEKINPQNFMSPYDSEKVRIANDLYSALLSSKGNKTIISMIKEKAESELGIKL